MKNFLSTKKKAKILAAGIGGATIFSANTAAAMDEYNIDWNGKNLFRVQYYGIDDTSDSSMGFLKTVYDQGTWLGWNLSDNLKEALNTAFNWWAEIIGPGANISQPAQVFVATNDEQNAFALSRSYKYGTEHYNPNLYHAIFQNAQKVTQFNNISEIPYIKNEDDVVLTDLENIGYGMICIWQNMGVNENNVESGAKLFGGMFYLEDMSAKLAEGFTDDTTGKFNQRQHFKYR